MAHGGLGLPSGGWGGSGMVTGIGSGSATPRSRTASRRASGGGDPSCWWGASSTHYVWWLPAMKEVVPPQTFGFVRGFVRGDFLVKRHVQYRSCSFLDGCLCVS